MNSLTRNCSCTLNYWFYLHLPISGWYRLAGVFWIPWQSQCLWTTECNTCTHFTCTCTEWTFDNLLLHFTCTNNGGSGFLGLEGNGSLWWLLQGFNFSSQLSTSFGWLFFHNGGLLLSSWLSLWRKFKP